MALFDLRGIEKSYSNGEVRVLRGVSFTIERGEFVSIMGPSGSGKSTLLHILGFLDVQTSGEYSFDGKQYAHYSEDSAARIRNEEMGFVFQQFNLLPLQSVYENVSLPLLYSRAPENTWDTKVKQVIDIVGLTHRTLFETYKLSGGEKQRTAIARALVNEPRVIFADEPTGNLDSLSGQAVMETLQRLHRDFGHTIILITHETYTAEHAERIIHIKDGLVESDGKVEHRRFAHDAFIK